MASPLPEPAPTHADKPLLAVLRGERRDPPPMWLMRQAGRYLPEYRELRATKGGFLDLVYDPEAAAEITLQPLRRFAVRRRDPVFRHPGRPPRDRAGPELRRRRGAAPGAAAGRRADPRPQAGHGAARSDLRDGAAGEGAIVARDDFPGLCRIPWTVATYMIAGQGSREQAEARQLAYPDPGKFDAILDIVSTQSRSIICRGQIEAGVDAVQLFDSWAGSLSPGAVRALGDRPTAWIVERAQAAPSRRTPIIGFPKGAGGKLARLCRAKPGVDAIGLDETVDPAWAATRAAGRTAGAGQSRSAGADRRRRGARERGQRASLTRSPTGPTSSTWATGSSRRRRSRMSSSWSRW